MLLTYLMLAVALALSAIAAFYSIIGLTAIFAAAVLPVAVMGSILEIAKIVVTVWLHEYWGQCKRAMKIYLVPAVAILMLITSMGIFGFLSKAHLDQAVPAGDVSAQVAIFDDKIKTQRDNIEAARAALRQLDAAVDQQMARSTDEQGAQRAANLRRQQGTERNRLNQDISRAQAEIIKLQEQRAPLAAEARKVEAEVGPIKYIAALIYGDNPDNNLLEKAVRWVIIILVIVFDPLAIFMLLAATESYKWEKSGRKRESEDAPVDTSDDPMGNKQRLQEWRNRWNKWRNRNATVDADTDTTPSVDERSTGNNMDPEPVAEMVGQSTTQLVGYEAVDKIQETEIPNVIIAGYEPTKETTQEENWKQEHDDGHVYFGRIFPRHDVNRGDFFLKINSLPTLLYKFNGEKWIEIDKNSTDRYLDNDQYVDFLIRKISTGEYDPELLNDAEREQISSRLKQDI